MAEPVPPPYSTAAANPSVPAPGYTNSTYNTAEDYAPAGGYAPAAGGYPPQPTNQPINYGAAYPPQPYAQPPPAPAYAPSGFNNSQPEPPNTYSNADPETGFVKNESPIISFDNKSIRLAFVRKVFGILGVQMLVTTGIICLFIFHEPTKLYVQNSMAMYISAYVLFLVLYFVLVCCKSVAKSYPANVILLGIFTLSLSYLVGVISSFHDTKIVLLLFGMTCIISLAIMIFACQTKYDFTGCGGALFVCSLSLFLFGIFAGVLVPTNSVRFVNIVYASLGALLFMVFLAFDTQLIMGGGRKYEMSPEDYIFAAMMLYVDIIYIFLFLLALFGGGNN